jgi:DNA-binding CsgD family transcriptional regulator
VDRESDRDLLWAAQVGALCGRAGEGIAPEWAFLDRWLELLEVDAGCLGLVRPDGTEQSYARGLTCSRSPLAGPELGVVDEGGEPTLQIAVRSADGLAASLRVRPPEQQTLGALHTVAPLVRRALLRLARGPASPADAAAIKAWNSARGPMLLLSADFEVMAANPAAARTLRLSPGGPLPPFLSRWLHTEFSHEAPARHGNWTANADGAEYHLSVVAVDPAEATPGRWLVSLNQGGPGLSGRLARAAAEFDLSSREHEILELLAEGLSNRLIAAALGIAETTVKFHLLGVMRKAGVSSRTELLARLHSLHLRDLDVIVPDHAERLSQAWVYEGAHDIVHWIQDDGAEMHGSDVEELYAWIRGRPLPRARRVYSDATGVRAVDRSAHEATTGACPEVEVAAIRGGSAVSRAVVNLWLRVTRPGFHARMFRDRGAAIEWLRAWP